MPVQNAEVAAKFDQGAELLEIQGENPFRVRAYRRAAKRRMAGVGFSLLETLRRGSGGLLYGRTLRGCSDRGIFQQYCEGDLCPRLRRS